LGGSFLLKNRHHVWNFKWTLKLQSIFRKKISGIILHSFLRTSAENLFPAEKNRTQNLLLANSSLGYPREKSCVVVPSKTRDTEKAATSATLYLVHKSEQGDQKRFGKQPKS
jgi:hypothetical protein